MSKPTPLEVAINAIKTAPRCNRGVHWAAKPTVMGLVAGWVSWTAHEFLHETMAELGLPGWAT